MHRMSCHLVLRYCCGAVLPLCWWWATAEYAACSVLFPIQYESDEQTLVRASNKKKIIFTFIFLFSVGRRANVVSFCKRRVCICSIFWRMEREKSEKEKHRFSVFILNTQTVSIKPFISIFPFLRCHSLWQGVTTMLCVCAVFAAVLGVLWMEWNQPSAIPQEHYLAPFWYRIHSSFVCQMIAKCTLKLASSEMTFRVNCPRIQSVCVGHGDECITPMASMPYNNQLMARASNVYPTFVAVVRTVALSDKIENIYGETHFYRIRWRECDNESTCHILHAFQEHFG